MPVRRAAQPKAKRPKFAPSSVSKTQKCILVCSALGLIAAAFVLPPVGAPSQSQNSILNTPEVSAESEKSAALPERLQSSAVATNRISLGGSPHHAGMPPLSEALPFAPSTVSDVSIALNVLASYLQNGSEEQKQEARLRIGEFRREQLDAALCDQIHNNESPALGAIAEIAATQKPDGVVDALIDRLNSTQRRIYARDVLIHALCQFSTNANAQKEIARLLENGSDDDRKQTWSQLGATLPAPFIQLALNRITDGRSDTTEAAGALARYGSTMQPAMKIVAEVEQQLSSAPQPVRLRLVEMLAGLEPNATASRLRMMTSDNSEDVRAVALKALARNPENTEVLLTALRNDRSTRVKMACIDGFGTTARPEVLSELITLLSDESLRFSAKRALVLVNNGADLGWQEVEWRAWLENSITTQRANMNR